MKTSLTALLSGAIFFGFLNTNESLSQDKAPVVSYKDGCIKDFKKSFSYPLNLGRDYGLCINDKNSCRLVELSKIMPGDLEIQLIGKDNSNIFIPIKSFLDSSKEYEVRVVGADGKERELDRIFKGDKKLIFYESPFKK